MQLWQPGAKKKNLELQDDSARAILLSERKALIEHSCTYKSSKFWYRLLMTRWNSRFSRVSSQNSWKFFPSAIRFAWPAHTFPPKALQSSFSCWWCKKFCFVYKSIKRKYLLIRCAFLLSSWLFSFWINHVNWKINSKLCNGVDGNGFSSFQI